MTVQKDWDIGEALDDYAEWTDTTSVYPDRVQSVYLALGLNEELGELEEAAVAAMRGAIWFPINTTPSSSAEVKEAGDVLWYTVRYATKVLYIKPSSLVKALRGSPLTSSRSAAARAAAILAGIEKKKLRGDAVINADTHSRAVLSIQTVLLYLIQRGDLQNVIDENKNKLTSRKERDVIKGSGDSR